MFKRIKQKVKITLYYLSSYKRMKFLLRKPSYSAKVFCIGYQKTGTTSIGKAFDLLGYKNSSFDSPILRQWYKNGEFDKILKYTAKYDSFDDLPWMKEDMIPVLDKTFPNSKFVYLTRDEESWKKSCYNWNKKRLRDVEVDVEQSWQGYKKHEKFVLDYFKDRSSSDFIILNIKDEKGFKKLADFLGKKVVYDKFPHFNKT